MEMNFNAAIEKLQAFLEKYKKEEVKFKDVKLVDGSTIVRYDGDTPVAGVPIFVITEEGELPAPDGDLTLEDGTMIKVVNGLIAEVVQVEAPAEETVETPMTEATKKVESQPSPAPKMVVETNTKEHHFTKEVEDSINDKFSALEKENVELKSSYSEKFVAIEKENSELKNTIKSLEEKFNDVVNMISELGEKPSEKPVEKKQTYFNISEFRKEFKADLRKINEKQIKNK